MTLWFKAMNTGDIAVAASGEVEWTTDKDYTITMVILTERADRSLSAVEAFVQFGDLVLTKDYVIAQMLGRDWETAWRPEILIPRGTRLYFRFTNRSAATVNIDVNLQLRE